MKLSIKEFTIYITIAIGMAIAYLLVFKALENERIYRHTLGKKPAEHEPT
jgi:hypothetical protein